MTHCKVSVRDRQSWRNYPCSRKAVRDGFCTQHHPDMVAARHKKQDDKCDDERKVRERKYATIEMNRRVARLVSDKFYQPVCDSITITRKEWESLK